MQNKKKVFLTGVLFSISLLLSLLLMSFAQAGPETYQFTINNDGDKAESYELSVDLFSEYITFSENPVSINSKESRIITLTADIPCENTGSYSLNFVVYARESKETIKIPFSINVPSCLGYDAQLGENVITKNATKIVFRPYSGIYELCANEKSSIPVLITNNAQPKSFGFDVTDIGFEKLSGKKLSLKANQMGVVYLNLIPAEEGNYTLNVSIATEKARKLPLSFEVKKCYSAWVDFGVDDLSICGCEPYSYDISVGNDGIKREEIALELDAPDWISLGVNQNFWLDAGENMSIGLNMNVQCAARKYSAKLAAYISGQPELKFEDSLGVSVVSKEECYKTAIEAPDRIVTDYDGISLPIKVISYGAQQIAYSVDIEGPEWVKS